jgi:NTE family protein
MPTPIPLRPQHQEELLLKHLRSFLGILDEAAIQMVRQRLRWVEVAGGETLMRQGEHGDALYMLVSGRLRVYIDEHEQRRIVREIARGEVVGEMSLYTDAPRSATLVAIRDSVLVSLDKADFTQLLATSPEVSTALTRQIIQRLQTERSMTLIDKPVTMALLPISAGVDAAALAASLAAQLSLKGRVGVLDSSVMARHFANAARASSGELGASQRRSVAMLLDEIESAHDYVLLVADAQPTEWTQMCARHADEILLLADANAPPVLHPNEQQILVDRPPRSEAAEILLLLHAADASHPSGTALWLNRRPVSGHVHLRLSHAPDIARLGRIQSRSAVGLVLAGGGARGFAHLGVYRALCEQGTEIDYFGGTSIGAVMAGFMASDLPFKTIDNLARELFARNPTGDFNFFPLISLFKGQRLRHIVGEAVDRTLGHGAHIEDLWKNFFCVATNFSKAHELVLQRGDLLKALLSSVAIPGALPPVVMNGDLICDGGTFNNFPVDVMRQQRGVGTVIGVDLSSSKSHRIAFDEMPGAWALLRDRLRPRQQRHYKLPSLANLLINTTVLYSASRQQQAKALTDLYFNPPLDRVGMLDWSKYDLVVQQGYQHALEVLSQGTEALTDGIGAGMPTLDQRHQSLNLTVADAAIAQRIGGF